MKQVFALVDCNNFYVSCERVFVPRLKHLPVVVLSNNDGNVISRSNEAKRLGVEMGTPLFVVRPLIEKEGVEVFSSNYALYGDMSARVKQVLARFSPRQEDYSIDESFLDLTGPGDRDFDGWGRALRAAVERETGIPVTVGIAETKTLAKAANKVAKRSPKTGGVLNLAGSPFVAGALARLDVSDVWGIGEAHERFLTAHGIETALDLRDAPDPLIRGRMGIVGIRLVRELRGESCLPLETVPPPKKMIGTAKGFGVLVERLEDLEEAAAVYAARVARKLRREGKAVAEMTVFIETDRFRPEPQYGNSAVVVPMQATNATPALIGYVRGAVRHLFKPGYRYKKLGVLCQELVPADEVQGSLFARPADPRRTELLKVVDQMNRVRGDGTLRFASEGFTHGWSTKFGKRSPRYTTRWAELPVVIAC